VIELRPYQHDAVDAVQNAEGRGITRPLVGLPTGTGKTVIFADLIRRRDEGPALILAHRDELLQQAAAKVRLVDPQASIGFVQADRDERDYPVVVASVQTLARAARLARMPDEWRTAVIDEAHHSTAPSYRRIMDTLNPDLWLGVSATLERTDKVGLGAQWQEIVYTRSLLDMIREGYLADIRALSIRVPRANFGRLRVSRGDFVDSEVGEMLSEADAPGVAAAAYLRHADGRRALVFTPTIALAHEMASAFRAVGVPAEAVDGQMPLEERRAILARLRSGETLVVPNALVLTEGFDEPSVSCVIVARPTRSRPFYVQMVGRGTRLWPGKNDLLVLDLVGNEERVDLVTIPRLFGLPPGETERGVVSSEQDRADRGRAAAGLYSGTLDEAEFSLFDRKRLNWLRLADGGWTLSYGDGTLLLSPENGTWAATAYVKETRKVESLAHSVDLGYAMGIAEEWMRHVVEDSRAAAFLVDPNARWRGDSPSDKQLGLLAKLGIAYEPTITRGEASDLITATFARRGR
jgi:ATP-dependent helicase IRC3